MGFPCGGATTAVKCTEAEEGLKRGASDLDMVMNIAAFKEKLGSFSTVSVSGGMTTFAAYNQLQADIYGEDVVLHKNRESTSLGAWISAAVTCGLYNSYERAFETIQPPGSETVFRPDPKKVDFYQTLNKKRAALYRSLQKFEVAI